MQLNSRGSGQKGLVATTRHEAKRPGVGVGGGGWPLLGHSVHRHRQSQTAASLAYLEDVAVLDFVLHRVIVGHDSTHDGIPAKRQHFVILWRTSYLEYLRPSLN